MRKAALFACLLLLLVQTQAYETTLSTSTEDFDENIVEDVNHDSPEEDEGTMLANDENDTIEESIGRLFEISMPKRMTSNCYRRPVLPEISAKNFDVINYWNEIALDTLRSALETPPSASRSLAIVHIAMYDAVNSILKKGRAYAIEIPAGRGDSPVNAASKAAQETLSVLYPQYADIYKQGYTRALNIGNSTPGKGKGREIGRAAAKAILKIRRNDGFTDADDPTYNPDSRTTGVWWRTPVPCPKGERPGNPPVYPRYGEVKPFAIPDARLFVTNPDPKKFPPICNEEVTEVKAIGERYSRTRTPKQTIVAIFYADGNGTATPPGHLNRIAQSIANSQRLDLHSKAEYFARVNIAMADAAIVTWKIKYIYNLWRPITAIRYSPCQEIRDKNWSPLFETPAFPSYTSGHSEFSASFARASQDFFGTYKINFVAPTEDPRLPDLYYSSLYDMAEEIGFSRLWGGIHFRSDINYGLISGNEVGSYASKRFLY